MFGHLGEFGLRLASFTICHLAHGYRRGAMWPTLYSDCLEMLLLWLARLALREAPSLTKRQSSLSLQKLSIAVPFAGNALIAWQSSSDLACFNLNFAFSK